MKRVAVMVAAMVTAGGDVLRIEILLEGGGNGKLVIGYNN